MTWQNHSCDPNCKILACYIDDADVNKPLLAVFTTRDVEPWEELCFSYYGDIDVSGVIIVRRAVLTLILGKTRRDRVWEGSREGTGARTRGVCSVSV